MLRTHGLVLIDHLTVLVGKANQKDLSTVARLRCLTVVNRTTLWSASLRLCTLARQGHLTVANKSLSNTQAARAGLKVEVVEIEDPPRIKFDYSIVDEAGYDLEKIHSDNTFITLLGDILVSIFDKNIIDDKKELDESPRINNIEESGI